MLSLFSKRCSFKALPSNLMTIMRHIGGKRSLTLNENEGKTIDKHHSHLLLLDNGSLHDYLSDDPRSKFVENMHMKKNCYTMTIIVEGGFNTFEVILNDLEAHRPVIIIQGSGRVADILGTLLKATKNDTKPT